MDGNHPIELLFLSDSAGISEQSESTPDGPLTTFKWHGGKYLCVAVDLLADQPFFLDMLPWTLRHLWHDKAGQVHYYERIDTKAKRRKL